MHTLTLDQLRTATTAGGIAAVMLKAEGGDFTLRITTRNGEAVLTKARGMEPRRFSNPAQAITLLCKLGIMAGSFDLYQWRPEQKSTAHARPDRAVAMKKAHAAVEHDRWFRAQVEQAIDEADAPNAEGVSQEAAEASWARKREGLLASLQGKST